MFEIDTATDYIDLLDRLDTFLSATGSAFGLTYAGTGNGTLTAYKGGASSVAETFTIAATSATNFTVTGTVSGSIGPATVGTPFSHAKLAFLLTAGGTAFVSGDTFTLSTAPPWTTRRRALGCSVLATQGNAGVNAAQNLVDGKSSGTSSSYIWQVNSPITIPQDVEFTFREAETIASYQLAAFSLLNGNAPSAWTLDYWNGSAWVTLDTRSSQSFGQQEVKSYTITSPVSATLYRLHITTIPFTNTVVLGAVRLLRSTGVDAAFGELIWEAPGNDGDSEIFLAVHPFERTDADYFNWELAGLDGYAAAPLLYDQVGYHGQLYLPLWDASIPYWFVANGRRVVVVAKISTQYEVAVLGLLDPYFSPAQFPYPMVLGGTLALEPKPTWESTTFRWSNSSNNHRAPTHADAAGVGSPVAKSFQLRARLIEGAYEGYESSSSDLVSSAPSASRNIIWPYRCGLSLLDLNLDGTYCLWPVMLCQASPDTLGELPGVKAVSGQGLSAETLLTKGEIDHLVIPNITRTDRDDWLAVALD